jgi:acyl-CoA synthetase (AMP-forming)/AMP-acid ligase II
MERTTSSIAVLTPQDHRDAVTSADRRVQRRLDDVIVRGGENLSPGEIENVLITHPAAAEAAVFGVPDEQWGEVVAAAVVLHPDSAATDGDLRDRVGTRMRSSRVPALIAFREALFAGWRSRAAVLSDLQAERPRSALPHEMEISLVTATV